MRKSEEIPEGFWKNFYQCGILVQKFCSNYVFRISSKFLAISFKFFDVIRIATGFGISMRKWKIYPKHSFSTVFFFKFLPVIFFEIS